MARRSRHPRNLRTETGVPTRSTGFARYVPSVRAGDPDAVSGAKPTAIIPEFVGINRKDVVDAKYRDLWKAASPEVNVTKESS